MKIANLTHFRVKHSKLETWLYHRGELIKLAKAVKDRKKRIAKAIQRICFKVVKNL
ncbi:hypothetical protein AAYQ05_15435 [Flavobacterium sp. B11]|uniref:hypothetical protein n=1 Tax=Flavobacterium movens TaxID=214860 RepID=UPI0031CF1660